MATSDKPPGRLARGSPTATDSTNSKTHIIASLDKARKILGDLDYIDPDDDITEENLILAIRQMAAQMAKLAQTKELAKVASAIALVWEEKTVRTAGDMIMTAVQERLDQLTTVRVSDKLTQISNRAVKETESLESKGQEVLDKIEKAADRLSTDVAKNLEATQTSLANTVKSYAQATAAGSPIGGRRSEERPTQHLEKRLCEGKQVLLDFMRDSGLPAPGKLSELEWVTKANIALERMVDDPDLKGEKGDGTIKALAVKLLRNGGVVIEMDSDSTATMIRSNQELFVRFIGAGWMVKDRTYTGKVRFVPAFLDLTRKGLRDRICEDSGLQAGDIVEISWMLDPKRRRSGQQVATTKMRFANAASLNHAIRNGILLSGKRLSVEKMEIEPTRCYNCQRLDAGHLANECKACITCANCSRPHPTNECQHREDPSKFRCVNCQCAGHASWDRANCRVYREKTAGIRAGRNAYKYVVTEEPWTWEKLWTEGGGFVPAGQLRGPPPPPRAAVNGMIDHLRHQNHTGPANQRHHPMPNQRHQYQNQLTDHGFSRQHPNEESGRRWDEDELWRNFGPTPPTN